ncbi:MAG TPA: TonB-dependent receptor [Puia sp.]|nr:TonB-dependent receptor [Puia sp.]
MHFKVARSRIAGTLPELFILLRIMRITAFILLITCLQVSAKGLAQERISLSETNTPIDRLFKEIRRQTHYQFLYTDRQLQSAKKVTIHVRDAGLKEVLDLCFKDQPFSYEIKDRTIIVSTLKERTLPLLPASPVTDTVPAQIGVTGRVVNEKGEPLEGVTVAVKGVHSGTITNEKGIFYLSKVSPGVTLVLSGVSVSTAEVEVSGRRILDVTLRTKANSLDETVVIAYGTTTKRFNTGDVSTVKAEDIAKNPVTDPLAALQGRVSGAFITASNGLPGSSFHVELRGRNSIEHGSDPLYIVDGVPYYSDPLDQFSSANGMQSPLSLINPEDIERIDLLKDADATSIYGSRGGNGVILITTKKGKAGKTNFNFNVYTGGSRVVNMLDMLNTDQYLQMRKDAFAHDGKTPDADNAPDLVTWDPHQNTNWQKFMIGHTAKVTQATGSISGGNQQTKFLLSATYRDETTVLAHDPGYQRGSVHLNVDHSSKDEKFNISASVSFASDKNNSLATDVTQYYNLAPNYPLYDTAGSLYWFSFIQNPQAYFLRKSVNRTTNLVASSTIRYTILPGLNLKAALGYNQSNMDQEQLYPDKTFNPTTSPGSMSYFGSSQVHSYSIEPQAEYTRQIGDGRLQLLAGGSWQQSIREGRYLQASGFSSDALMEDIYSATSVIAQPSTYTFYRYTSVFGRANYILSDKYILNASFRRDGSTRFGPGHRFGNFGAIGAGWIFSKESFVPAGSFLSYGKLRASYGTSGNDQVGDYSYLDSWTSASFPYDGISGLSPARIPNPDYRWEMNHKLEFGLDLGFLKDRVLLTAGFYRNFSNNQLLQYMLSPQAGFPSITANFPASVLNRGWEFELNTRNIEHRDFSWKTSFNITLPVNQLQKYPNLENSSYSDVYVVGKSLSIVKGFKFTGVDPTTGVPQFLDVNKDDAISDPDDYVVMGKTLPDFYGGLGNSITYKHWSLDFLFQFVKQEGPTVNYGYLSSSYGTMNNKDLTALDRWRQSGDITYVPAASLTSGNPVYNAYQNQYRLSSAAWGDASYIRLKNVALNYDLSPYVRKWGLSGLSVYALAQNLVTITHYRGFDPETQGTVVPPLKTITAGVKLSF